MFGRRNNRSPEDEDFFKESRMSFGDHLEELRSRMWRALYGLGICLVIGFILDGVGDYVGKPWIGIGKPMLKVITDPVEEQVKIFNLKRAEDVRKKQAQDRKDEVVSSLTKTSELQVEMPIKAFTDNFEGLTPKDPEQKTLKTTIRVSEVDIHLLGIGGEANSNTRGYLTGLGVMEAFMVYIKVSLLCGVVIACPWIFWQFWSFVGAGLYPHEKKLVHVYMPFSILLFLGGILLCQFVVLPRAVAAMLSFYGWINVDPDLRLNEWLGFAIAMPLVFGLAFQTPLVMMFLNRIGVFGWEDYLRRWRHAIFGVAVLSAVLTPSTDVISMLWLFVPTFGLYMLGILLCYLMPPPPSLFGPPEEEEVGV